MDKSLQFNIEIHIHASPNDVWKALTEPHLIAQYLYGTKFSGEWKVGAILNFEGEFSGTKYKDKGLVMAVVDKKIIAYDYWSSFSGLEDLPENYTEVSYHINERSDGTVNFSWQQIGFASQEKLNHLKTTLPELLKTFKKVAESL